MAKGQKITVRNTGTTEIVVSYQKLSDLQFIFGDTIQPGKTKNFWVVKDTFKSSDNRFERPIIRPTGRTFPGAEIIDIEVIPRLSPTPTRTSRPTPTNTPTNTVTPSTTSSQISGCVDSIEVIIDWDLVTCERPANLKEEILFNLVAVQDNSTLPANPQTTYYPTINSFLDACTACQAAVTNLSKGGSPVKFSGPGFDLLSFSELSYNVASKFGFADPVYNLNSSDECELLQYREGWYFTINVEATEQGDVISCGKIYYINDAGIIAAIGKCGEPAPRPSINLFSSYDFSMNISYKDCCGVDKKAAIIGAGPNFTIRGFKVLITGCTLVNSVFSERNQNAIKQIKYINSGQYGLNCDSNCIPITPTPTPTPTTSKPQKVKVIMTCCAAVDLYSNNVEVELYPNQIKKNTMYYDDFGFGWYISDVSGLTKTSNYVPINLTQSTDDIIEGCLKIGEATGLICPEPEIPPTPTPTSTQINREIYLQGCLCNFDQIIKPTKGIFDYNKVYKDNNGWFWFPITGDSIIVTSDYTAEFFIEQPIGTSSPFEYCLKMAEAIDPYSCPPFNTTPTPTPSQTSTVTPSQTKPSNNCICHEIEVIGSSTCVINWLDCYNVPTEVCLNSGETLYVCAVAGSITTTCPSGNSISIISGSSCNEFSQCIPNPTPTPTPTMTQTTPTSGDCKEFVVVPSGTYLKYAEAVGVTDLGVTLNEVGGSMTAYTNYGNFYTIFYEDCCGKQIKIEANINEKTVICAKRIIPVYYGDISLYEWVENGICSSSCTDYVDMIVDVRTPINISGVTCDGQKWVRSFGNFIYSPGIYKIYPIQIEFGGIGCFQKGSLISDVPSVRFEYTSTATTCNPCVSNAPTPTPTQTSTRTPLPVRPSTGCFECQAIAAPAPSPQPNVNVQYSYTFNYVNKFGQVLTETIRPGETKTIYTLIRPSDSGGLTFVCSDSCPTATPTPTQTPTKTPTPTRQITTSGTCYSTVNFPIQRSGNPYVYYTDCCDGIRKSIFLPVNSTAYTVNQGCIQEGSMWIAYTEGITYHNPCQCPPTTPTPTTTKTPTQTPTKTEPLDNCTTAFVPPLTINGVSTTEIFTGSVITTNTGWTSCGGAIFTPPTNKLLGSTGPFSYTVNFSVPQNNVVILLAATGGDFSERFTLTTNTGNGIPLISSTINCFTTISGNTILSGFAAPGGVPGGTSGGGGGKFVITNSVPFTSLTIVGNGGQNGSFFSICADQIKPAITPTPTKTTNPTPTPTVTKTSGISTNYCEQCNLGFEYSRNNLAGTIEVGDMTGTCSITDYQILWYGPNSNTNVEFTSGFGNTTGFDRDITHPFARPSLSGLYKPVIKKLRFSNGTILDNLNLECFQSIGVDGKITVVDINCDNGNLIGENYTHKYEFNNASYQTPPKSLKQEMSLSLDTKFLAVDFEAFNVYDDLKITFLSNSYPVPIILENVRVSSSYPIQNWKTLPNRPLKEIQRLKKVITLTGLTRTSNDKLLIEVSPNITNPQTNWVLQLKCLTGFSQYICDDMYGSGTSMKIVTESVTGEFDGQCSTLPRFTISGCTGRRSQSDPGKYMWYFANEFENGVTDVNMFPPLSSLNTTCGIFLYGYGSENCVTPISPNPLRRMSFIKTPGNLRLEFADFNDFKSHHDDYLLKLNTGGYVNDPNSVFYYQLLEYNTKMTTNELDNCGDGSFIYNVKIHKSSIVTTAFTDNKYVMNLTLPKITRQVNFGNVCTNCNGTIDTFVNSINFASDMVNSGVTITNNRISQPFEGQRVTLQTSSTPCNDWRDLWIFMSVYQNHTYPMSGDPLTFIPSLSGQAAPMTNFRLFNPGTDVAIYERAFAGYRSTIPEGVDILDYSSSDFDLYSIDIENYHFVNQNWADNCPPASGYTKIATYSGGTTTVIRPEYFISSSGTGQSIFMYIN